MIQKLLLPSLIPTKRFSSTLISIVLASAIFSGTVIGISTLDQQSTNFYDNRPNTVIIYDTTVNTPFTSRIPEEVLKSLQVLPGVISYSGEILQPAVIGEEPTFYRGVNLTDLRKFDPTFEITQANKGFKDLQPKSALVGQALQARFNLQIGDKILATSTITGRHIQVEVEGFFTSDLPYRFEILVSIPTAQYLASYIGQLTHVQVNYDPDLLDEKIISSVLTQKFEFIVNVGFDNGSVISELQLIVLDAQNKGLVSGPANASQRFFLPAGTYRVVLRSPTEVLREERVELTEDTSMTLRTGEYAYKVNLNFTYGNLPFQGFNYSVFSSRHSETGFSADPTLELKLREDNYTLVVPLGDQPLILELPVNGPFEGSVDVSELFPQIRVAPPDDAIFLTSEFSFRLEGLLPRQNVVLRTAAGTFQNESLRLDNEHGLVAINATDGKYILEIIEPRTIPETVMATYKFSVNTSLNIISGSLVPYGHYIPGENVSMQVEPSAFQELSVTANGNPLNYSVNGNNLAFSLPQTKGVYTIEFTFIDHAGQTHVMTSTIIVDSESALAGWRMGNQLPTIFPNVSYPIWHKGAVLSLSSNWVYLPGGEGYGFVKLIGGNETSLNLTLTTGIAELNFSLANSISTEISSYNSTGSNFDLLSNSIINTSDVIFDFNPWKYKIVLNMDNEDYVLTPGFPYSIGAQLTNMTIGVFQINGGIETMVANLTVAVNDTLNLPDLPIPHFQFINGSNSGIFVLDDYEYTFKFLNGTKFQPMLISPTKVVLPPNDYLITTSGLGNSNFTFFLNVPKYTRSNLVDIQNNTLIYLEHGYLKVQNESISLADGVYFQGNSTFALISKTSQLTLPPLPYLSTESIFNGTIRGARYAKYSLIFGNGTRFDSIYNGSMFLSLPNEGTVDLELTVIDHFGDVAHLSSFVGLNQKLREFSLSIIMRDNSSFPDFGLDIKLNQSSTFMVHMDGINSTLLLFNADLTIQEVTTVETSIPFSYEVDYILGLITLKIFNPWIRVFTQNLNEGVIDPYTGNATIIDPSSRATLFNGSISKLEKITLPSSDYTIAIMVGETHLEFNFTVGLSKDLKLALPIHYQSITVSVTKLGNFFVKEVVFRHKVIGQEVMASPKQKSADLEVWSVSSFPYGEIEIEVVLSNSRKHTIERITSDVSSISIEATLDFSGLNDRFADPSLLNKGAINVNLGATSSSNYLESFLGNLITLIRLVFLAELIVISFILIINILRSVDFFVILSKKELRTLLSIGNSRGWSIGLISRELVLITPTLSFVGYTFGFGLLSYFVNLNHLTLFGKDLTFEFWEWELILLNLLGVFFMVLASIILEIRRINEENLVKN